uniref:LolA family protein n=1 Tax=Cellvibrio fontiphilus TaxID=1815559 RepID=UPI002B4BC15F|nr:hypothetical protein [Cellvibrio fontiphilus]
MKKIIACLLCLTPFVAWPLQAADTAILQEYLPQSCYQLGRYQQQKSVRGLVKPIETQGYFAFACDKGLLWHTSAPLTETLIYRLQGATRLVRGDGSQQKLSGVVQRQLGQMLNNLLGGNKAYLERAFVIARSEQGIQLVPRKKRMEKFLQRIDIAREQDTVSIRLQHPGGEYTAIRVHAIQSFELLNTSECSQQLAVERSADLCQQLFNP